MSIDNWRLANVNTLICDTYRAIHKISDDVEFGISPQGNIDNNAQIYADVKHGVSAKVLWTISARSFITALTIPH